MQKRLSVSLVSITAAAWFALVLGCAAPIRMTTPASRGEAEAQQDVAEGKIKLLEFGLPTPWASEYNTILKDRYGIQPVYVAGCVVTEELVQHAHTYNEVSMAAARRKFGNDVFEKTVREAIQNYQTGKTSKPEMAKR